jgi:hypothetical protein
MPGDGFTLSIVVGGQENIGGGIFSDCFFEDVDVVLLFFDGREFDLEFVGGVDFREAVDFSDVTFGGNALVFFTQIRFDLCAFGGGFDDEEEVRGLLYFFCGFWRHF